MRKFMKETLMKMIIFFFVLSGNLFAEVPSYQITENTGLNKQERIDYLDKYMANLSSTLKNFEAKLDDNSKKMKELESSIKALKGDVDKKIDFNNPSEKNSNKTKELGEVEKLKADFLVLKNNDIEKLKTDVYDLRDELKVLLKTVKEH